MAGLEDLAPGTAVTAVLADGVATVVDGRWIATQRGPHVTEDHQTLKVEGHGFEKS